MVVETSGKPSLPITGKTDDSMEGSTQVAVSAKVRALELEYMTLLEKRIADLKDGLQGDSASSKATSDDKLPDGPAKVPEESSTKAQVPSLSTKDSARETENGSSQEAQIESSEKQNDKDGENMAELKSRFRFIQEDEHGVEQETDTSLTLEKSLEQNAGSSVGKAAEVRRIMVENKVYDSTTINVQSPGLNALLLFALAKDPRINHGRKSPEQRFSSPFEPLIHHWTVLEDLTNPGKEGPWTLRLKEEIESTRKQVKSTDATGSGAESGFLKVLCNNADGVQDATTDLKLLMQIVQSTPDVRNYFQRERKIQEIENSVTFELLWTLFPPGELVFTGSSLKSPQLFVVEQADHQIYGRRSGDNYWRLAGWYLDIHDRKFVQMAAYMRIDRFEKSKSITKLPCFPLRYHPERARIEELLLTRGKKFFELCRGDPTTYSYEGFGFLHGGVFEKSDLTRSASGDSESMTTSEETLKGSRNSFIEGDVIMDFAAFQEYAVPVGISSKAEGLQEVGPTDDVRCRCEVCERNVTLAQERREQNERKDGRGFKDLDYQLLPPRALGYWLSRKRWVELDLDKLKAARQADEKAWEMLQMGPGRKDLIRRVVRNHNGEESQLKDLAKGKGNGLVILLHGPPGVGKTLTAESIATDTRRPLLSLGVSDVGIEPAEIERKFWLYFDLAAKWRAILLFDEADVFSESRESHLSVNRNALVSVLLRILEYFTGSLIMTTNRIRSLDFAVQSRINLAFKFRELETDQKLEIYEHFIDKLSPDHAEREKLKTKIRNKEVQEDVNLKALNGRQIRNVVFAAATLAGRNNVLRWEDMLKVLMETKEFNRDLERLSESAVTKNTVN